MIYFGTHFYFVYSFVNSFVSFLCSTEGAKLSVVGSPFWMAPEVLRDEPYNEKVCVHALRNLVEDAWPARRYQLIFCLSG